MFAEMAAGVLGVVSVWLRPHPPLQVELHGGPARRHGVPRRHRLLAQAGVRVCYSHPRVGDDL